MNFPTPAAEPAARFTAPGGWQHGLGYGLLGLPLAFVALPLYVILPNHYAREFAAPLAALGAGTTRRMGKAALSLLLLGTLLFSGSLVGGALGGLPTRLAPAGGITLMLGWVLWAVDAVRR